MHVTILTETELRQQIEIDQLIIDAIADGFSQLAQGNVTMPPILRLDIPEHNGEVDVKTAYIRGLDSFAIKVSPGFFDNYKLGLPSLSGLMMLFSAETGFLKAVHLDNGYLTDVRTGAAGAVAAHYLARRSIKTVGVIGSGAQARFQILALSKVRDFERLLVYGRTSEHVQKYIDDMTSTLDLEATAVSSPEEIVRHSDIVVTTTPAEDGFLKAEWLHPGLHITAMGSDGEHKQELEAQVFARADVIVCDRKSQAFRLGELHHALDLGILNDDSSVIELGEVVNGSTPGRTNDQQVTICDLTGTGMQDTVIARMAFEKAHAASLGTTIEIQANN